MSSPILQMRKIEKRFPGVHALKGVDFEVYAGEMVALLGENGAGKLTLMFAKWLAPDPKVLIFDAPMRGIDVGAKAEIREVIQKLAEAGVAIVMISSDMEQILHISDRVAIMHEEAKTEVLERDARSEGTIRRLAVGGRERLSNPAGAERV